jgi:protein-disulfide isomerase
MAPFGSPAHAMEVKEQVLGDENAPVTIIEYASLTCPHCASFHNEMLPTIKEEYIDTGNAKLVMRDFPLDQLALIASVLAHCSGPDRYFKFLEYFFANQDSWARSEDPVGALRKQSKLGGLSDAEMDACLNDESMAEGVLKLSYQGQQEHEVRSTPTFVINGDILSGTRSIDEFRAAIDAHLD